MKNILLIVILFFGVNGIAQQDAWVYFNAKDNVQASLDNPISILSQQAIDRKNTHGVSIDERDVPVNETFIALLKAPETGITVFAKSKWFNAVYVRGSEEAINALVNNFDFVESVEFADQSLNSNSRISVENDKFSVEDTNVTFTYGSTQEQIEQIGVNFLHLDDFTGEGIVVAVMDSGFPNVDTMDAFQRLRDNGDLLGGYDFVDRNTNVHAFTGNDHGTKVLSTMAGFVQDQYVGTAPDASYYLFRTEDVSSETPVEEAYWVEAAERADSLGVHIINTSLGYKAYDNPNYSHSNEDLNGNSTFITKGANIANEKGILVVTSAGNSGASGVGAPADGVGVLSIGAVDVDGNYAGFSSQGSAFQPTQKPDVSARGAAAVVINDQNVIVNNNGTSFSSPIMAGGIAALWQARPDATNNEIMQYVRMSASQYDNPDYFLGYGIPNLQMALDELLSVESNHIVGLEVFPNPASEFIYIQLPHGYNNISVKMYDMLGKLILEQHLDTSSNRVDVSSMSKGMYLLSIQSTDLSKTLKLIKS